MTGTSEQKPTSDETQTILQQDLEKESWVKAGPRKAKEFVLRRVWKRTASDLTSSWIALLSSSKSQDPSARGIYREDRAGSPAEFESKFEIDVAVVTGFNLVVVLLFGMHLAELNFQDLEWIIHCVLLAGAAAAASLVTLASIWKIHRINSAYLGSKPEAFATFCFRPALWNWSIFVDAELDPPKNGG